MPAPATHNVDGLLAYVDVLKTEIAELKQKLALESNRDIMARLMARFRFTPMEARMTERLFAANGRLVTKQGLMDALYSGCADEPEIKIIDVFACKLRAKVGFDMIETVWGQGYRMTPAGAALVGETLAMDPGEIEATDAPPRQRRINSLQAKAIAHMDEAGRVDRRALAVALDISPHRAGNIISCLVHAKRAKAVDWFKGPDGLKRTIYSATDAGRAYAARQPLLAATA